MATTSPDSARIATLDIVRGIAVMGILAMNIVAFAMPFAAYMNPAAYGGDSGINLGSWLVSFILVDGKMRGLFSILFGASTLLVIDRAARAGASGGAVHFRRMAVLLLFGLVHFYFIWFGDILSLYAMCGMVIYAFRNRSPRALVAWAIGFFTISFLIFSAMSLSAAMAGQPDLPPEQRQGMEEARRQIDLETGASSPRIAEELALYRGGYAGQVEQRLGRQTFFPLQSLFFFGWETLGLMLLGMALFKSGYLTGAWDSRRYRKWAAICFSIGVPGAIALALLQLRSGFDSALVFGSAIAWSMPFDILIAVGWAALIILWSRHGASTALRDRVAAAGRMAFTNYLMTSVLMTALFYGWGIGLFGQLDRAALWLPVLGMWGMMLAWSKPWLDRYRYGPLEWLWRSLSRGSMQPMRLPAPA